MGEVYKANDTQLDRAVAIKVLPSHLSSDAGLRERFEREARTVSSLNHPHICTLHNVGREDGVDKNGDKLMAVDVRTDSTFDAETPRVLFEQLLPESALGRPSRYGVSPDGQRILIISPAETDEEAQPAEIHVVVNWFQELERLAPSRE